MINVWNKSRAPKQTFTYMKKLHINTQVYGAPGKKNNLILPPVRAMNSQDTTLE